MASFRDLGPSQVKIMASLLFKENIPLVSVILRDIRV